MLNIADDDLVYFYDYFAADVTNFEISRGERKQIVEIGINVAKQLALDSKYYSVEKYKKKIDPISYYGQRIPVLCNAISSGSHDMNKLKQKLLEKVIKTLSPSKLDKTISISVQSTRSGSITGTIECPLCSTESVTAYWHTKANSSYWIVGNFSRHLRDRHVSKKRKQRKSTKSESDFEVDGELENGIASQNEHEPNVLPIDVDDQSATENRHGADVSPAADLDVHTDVENDHALNFLPSVDINDQFFVEVEKTLFNQLSVQLLNMRTKRERFGGTIESISFKIGTENARVDVTTVKPDGHCLFRALCHQLFEVQLDSPTADEYVKKLRSAVVNYIRANIGHFKHELKGRLFDEKIATNNQASVGEKKFLESLEGSSKWGGAESLKAVSLIYKVNIVIITENDCCYLASGFKTQYDRTVILAHRAFGNSYNHYDSVCEMKNEFVYRSMKSIVITIKKCFFDKSCLPVIKID